ncbi:MAG: hypothetical protein M3P96_05460 [Actinomycetota bacterium]|nr:hypothetical protein [Actinomycetota bacterium]
MPEPWPTDEPAPAAGPDASPPAPRPHPSEDPDLLDELEKRIKADGAVIESPQGEKAHPAAVEARQQRIALARLLGALRLPAGEQEAGDRRPQRRTGVRGVYRTGPT